MDKPVSSLMTTPARTVRADDTVAAVEEQFRLHGLSLAPVVDSPGGTVLGIISASDLLQFQAAKRNPASVHAWEICAYKPVEVGPDASIGDVASLMVARRIHHVVVMENQTLKGVVSALDFVRQFIQQD